MKLFACADSALWADHPFQLHRDQFRTLTDDGFETRIVVGQAFDLVVQCFVFWQDIVEPQ
ncbi:hypothetical protein D3C76_1207040 [compost metagenome]